MAKMATLLKRKSTEHEEQPVELVDVFEEQEPQVNDSNPADFSDVALEIKETQDSEDDRSRRELEAYFDKHYPIVPKHLERPPIPMVKEKNNVQ